MHVEIKKPSAYLPLFFINMYNSALSPKFLFPANSTWLLLALWCSLVVHIDNSVATGLAGTGSGLDVGGVWFAAKLWE